MARIGPHVTVGGLAAAQTFDARHSTFVPIAAALSDAKAETEKQGFLMRAAQIFVMGPRDRTKRVDGQKAFAAVRRAAEKLTLMVHSSYRNSNPWRGDPTAAQSIRDELAICAEIGAHGLVVHLPVGPPEWVLKFLPALIAANGGGGGGGPEGVDRQAEDVADEDDDLILRAELKNLILLAELKNSASLSSSSHAAPTCPRANGGAVAPRIYLELVACRPENSRYETPAKIAQLFAGIRKFDPELKRFGFCVDTAHLWACGVDISSYERAERWFNDLELTKPPPVVVHLNDNRWGLGEGRDEHAQLFAGSVWGKYKHRPRESGLAAILDYARRNETVVILERRPANLPADYRSILRLQPDLKIEAELAAPVG